MAHWKEMENSWEVCIADKNPYGPGQKCLNFDSQSHTATWTKKQTKKQPHVALRQNMLCWKRDLGVDTPLITQTNRGNSMM